MSEIDVIAPIVHGEPAPIGEPETGHEPVTFDSRQQALVDRLIKESQGRAGRAAREEAARLKTENERLQALAVGNSPDASEVEKLRAQVADEKLRASAAEQRAAKQEKAVLQARLGASINAVDTESVSKLLADRLATHDGKVVVLDESGVEQTNQDGSPTTPEQLYRQWAEAHPWAIRGSVVSGTGQGSSLGGQPPAQIPLEKIFGRSSESRIAQEYSRRNGGRDYRLAKIEAQKRGLI